MNVTLENYFYSCGKNLMSDTTRSEQVGLRRFKSAFGVSPRICSIVWFAIKGDLSQDIREEHLLWTLLFLKCYNSTDVNRAIVKCDAKTFRTKVWSVIDVLAFIKVILWENRKINAVAGQTCFTSIDGVDFKIAEPSPFDPSFYSHKFKSAGLRYEIGLCLRTGEIVWAHGGFPCGRFPDLKIARDLFVEFLDEGERAVADRGYQDGRYFLLPNANNKQRHATIMSRHETINKRLRHFKILDCKFRHDKVKHIRCFHSVVNLVQLTIKHEEPLFSIF
uniref:CSON015158 protein n=1 Tax=Culicoides sonorensis TaxID=179676 RepID=A0A336L3F9_CULSO